MILRILVVSSKNRFDCLLLQHNLFITNILLGSSIHNNDFQRGPKKI